MSSAIDIILKRIRDLPILNVEAYRLIDYCSKPTATFETLEGMVNNSPNLVGQIFRLANSAFYQRQKKPETLKDAIILLGMGTLKQIFAQNFYQSLGKMLGTQTKVLDHGRDCARLAEFLGRSAGMSVTDIGKIRLGGLLHDIGQLFMAFSFPPQFEQAKRLSKSEKIPSYQAETKVFGVNHQEVGAVLCKRWNFPDYMIQIVRTHHPPCETGIPTLIAPVYCGNGYLNQRDGSIFQPYETALKEFFLARRVDMPWTSFRDECGKLLATQPPNL